MKTFATLTLALLAGCATARQTYTQDGRPGHTIECGGTMNSWDSCYQKAGELCGSRGYDVQSKDGDTGYMASGSGESYVATQTVSRSLVIACR